MWPWEKKRSRVPEAPSVIGATVRIKGPIESEGELVIFGQVEGDVIHHGRLVIGEGAHCTGNVRATEMELAGEVHGNLFVENGLHLQGTARLYGDTRCSSIRIDAGAVFFGANRMVEAPLRLPAPGPASASAAADVLSQAISDSLAILMEPVGIAEREMLGVIPASIDVQEFIQPEVLPEVQPDGLLDMHPEVLPELRPAAPPIRLEAPAFYGGFSPAFRTSKIA